MSGCGLSEPGQRPPVPSGHGTPGHWGSRRTGAAGEWQGRGLTPGGWQGRGPTPRAGRPTVALAAPVSV